MTASKSNRARAHGKDRTFRDLLLAATAVTAGFGVSLPAMAQESRPAASESDELVVTGSRAARSGFAAPTPTAVINSELVDRQAATGIGAVLVQNPAFKGTRNPGANATNTSSPAQWTADLRGLGGQRTLVLVNGSRIVPFAPASNLNVPTTTDLNLIPTLMIDRVEVVTGGASAQYGSDAVAGVVNILLKRQMDGFEVRAQAGISQESDNETLRIGFVGGRSFLNDRAHLVISGDYDRNDGVRDIYTRDWGSNQWMIVNNTGWATNGMPALLMSTNVNNALGAGGVIVGPAGFSLNGQTFNPDGSLRPFEYGSVRSGALMIGGEGSAIITGTDLVPRVERFTTYGRFEYEFTPNLRGHFALGYSESEGHLTGVPIRLTAQTIRDDNAFLPAEVQTAMASAGITSFTMSRIGQDMRVNEYIVTNKSPRFNAGFEGEFGDGWDWDVHYSYGRNDYSSLTRNNPITANLQFALDAVRDPISGNIVCRATLPGPSFNAAAAGCVPLNMFGNGSPSEEARAYVNQGGTLDVEYIQQAFAANLRGEPFSTWAGPVSASTGIEWREEEEVLTADAIGGSNGFLSAGNAVPWSGKFDVLEGYVEAIIPLARDAAFARLFDLNAAVRYAEYSTAGGQTAWKIGAVWEPADWLRLRTTRSRDIRAPALNELFSPGSNVRNVVTVLGRSASIPQNTSLGNPNVEPEFADTTTLGFVIQPGGALQGLRLSLDYYNIEIDGAITNLSTANIATLCTQGNQSFCDYFTFDDAGNPTSLTAPAMNIGSYTSSGYDLVIDYQFDFGPGTMQTSFSGTYVTDSIVDTGTGSVVNRAGENGWANFGGLPTFRGNLSQTFRTDDYSVTLQAIYISSGKLDVLYNTAPNLTINNNTIPARTYLNLYGSYNLTESVRLFGAVNNLLDQDPPASPYPILNQPVNGNYYDKVGRAFQLGVHLRF